MSRRHDYHGTERDKRDNPSISMFRYTFSCTALVPLIRSSTGQHGTNCARWRSPCHQQRAEKGIRPAPSAAGLAHAGSTLRSASPSSA